MITRYPLNPGTIIVAGPYPSIDGNPSIDGSCWFVASDKWFAKKQVITVFYCYERQTKSFKYITSIGHVVIFNNDIFEIVC